MRVILSGLTAAGKTTHGDLLARHYKLRFVRMVDVMREVLQARHPKSAAAGVITEVWTTDWDALREENEGVDREADRRMVAEVASAPGIYDAWALPWLYDAQDAIRIWIESDATSRARKNTVSALMRGEQPPASPSAANADKDDWTRAWFQRLYGFDLQPSAAHFDVIADNSELIPTPTIECAERGIASFHPRLTRAIDDLAST